LRLNQLLTPLFAHQVFDKMLLCILINIRSYGAKRQFSEFDFILELFNIEVRFWCFCLLNVVGNLIFHVLLHFLFVYKNECFWSGDVIFTQFKLILLGPPNHIQLVVKKNKKN
jgi:hypothetical protein